MRDFMKIGRLSVKWALIAVIGVYGIACYAEPGEPAPFPEFWSQFHQAIMTEDYATLKAHTQFPLEVLGVHDAIPARHIGEDEFPAVIQKVLEEPVSEFVGASLVEEPLISFLESKKSLDKDEWQNTEQVRIKNFVFDEVDGDWVLVRAYMQILK